MERIDTGTAGRLDGSLPSDGDRPAAAAGAAPRTSSERAVETGTRGAGGDHTLVLDRSAEDVVFAELDALHDDGLTFTAISEERGEQRFGADGAAGDHRPDRRLAQRQARRLPLSRCRSRSPTGETMADVAFGFVHDFGARRAVVGAPGRGRLAGHAPHRRTRCARRLDPSRGDRRSRDGTLEVVGIESADPRWVRDQADALVDVAHRLRALGTIAVSLCAVAAARHDGLVTLRRARGVDSAAGQLIVREAGGLVSFPDCAEPLGAPLDASPASRVVAARSERGLRDLEQVGA